MKSVKQTCDIIKRVTIYEHSNYRLFKKDLILALRIAVKMSHPMQAPSFIKTDLCSTTNYLYRAELASSTSNQRT